VATFPLSVVDAGVVRTDGPPSAHPRHAIAPACSGHLRAAATRRQDPMDGAPVNTTTVERSSTSKRRLAVAIAAATGLAIGTLPLTSPAAATPVESSCNTQAGGTGISGFTSHAQLGSQLERIERSSQGRVEVDVAGYTNQGREIWSARVGEGDRVVLIQSEIHGNEKHGTEALLRVLSTLGNNSPRSAEIREAITLVAIPKLNADGSELDQRRNDMTWDDVVASFPQLEDAQEAWNYSSRQGGFDVNRDFNPDLDYVPSAADFPGNSASTGWYITPAAQTVRDVYAGLEEEFGLVEVFVDLHGQGPCYVGEGVEDEYSPLSISGRFIADPSEFGDWPNFDYDASRRANLAVYDALQGNGQSSFGNVTLYPQNTNLPGTALGSFALRGSATVLFETSSQTQSLGHKRAGMFIRQVEVGVMGIIDGLTDGTYDELDPERYDEIPERRFGPRD
jgi:hypothetical protein